MALCSLSTGSTSTPWRLAASMTTAPPMTRISLLASAMRLPAPIAGARGPRRPPPARPGGSTRSSRGSRCESSELQVPDEDVVDGSGEQPAVDAIEHAAVPRDERARVLHAGAALQQRLEQVAHDPERGDAGAGEREQ